MQSMPAADRPSSSSNDLGRLKGIIQVAGYQTNQDCPRRRHWQDRPSGWCASTQLQQGRRPLCARYMLCLAWLAPTTDCTSRPAHNIAWRHRSRSSAQRGSLKDISSPVTGALPYLSLYVPICVQTASVNCARYCEGVFGWFACGAWPLTCACAGCGPPWCGGRPVVGDGCWCAIAAFCDAIYLQSEVGATGAPTLTRRLAARQSRREPTTLMLNAESWNSQK